MKRRVNETTDPACFLALTTLDGAFTGRGWQGATLSGSLRGVTARHALWRPAPGRRCIWEHVLHAAYWKYALLNVFAPDHGVSFARSPSNWPTPPSPALTDRDLERQWKADRAYLGAMHKHLRDAIGAFDFSRVTDKGGVKKQFPFAAYVAGAAAHDAYHCGQVQLIKRLMPR